MREGEGLSSGNSRNKARFVLLRVGKRNPGPCKLIKSLCFFIYCKAQHSDEDLFFVVFYNFDELISHILSLLGQIYFPMCFLRLNEEQKYIISEYQTSSFLFLLSRSFMFVCTKQNLPGIWWQRSAFHSYQCCLEWILHCVSESIRSLQILFLWKNYNVVYVFFTINSSFFFNSNNYDMLYSF